MIIITFGNTAERKENIMREPKCSQLCFVSQRYARRLVRRKTDLVCLSLIRTFRSYEKRQIFTVCQIRTCCVKFLSTSSHKNCYDQMKYKLRGKNLRIAWSTMSLIVVGSFSHQSFLCFQLLVYFQCVRNCRTYEQNGQIPPIQNKIINM